MQATGAISPPEWLFSMSAITVNTGHILIPSMCLSNWSPGVLAKSDLHMADKEMVYVPTTVLHGAFEHVDPSGCSATMLPNL